MVRRTARNRSTGGSRNARVARLAEEFLGYCDALDRQLAGRHPHPNAHLQDAATSILANIGEGLDEISPGDKRRFFRYALRSAGECERLLHGLHTLHALPHPTLTQGQRHLLDIKLDLLRLIRWTTR